MGKIKTYCEVTEGTVLVTKNKYKIINLKIQFGLKIEFLYVVPEIVPT